MTVTGFHKKNFSWSKCPAFSVTYKQKSMVKCRIEALAAQGQFSLTDCSETNFMNQATGGIMIWQIDPNYEITELLGCGVYGTVCRARNVSTGQIVAIKRIDFSQVCFFRAQTHFRSAITRFCLGQHVIRTQRTSSLAPGNYDIAPSRSS